MKRYLVELEAGEREALEAITRKGSHRSQKVLNALVLLNCDAGECNERRATGRKIAGRRQTKVTERRTKTDWARFLRDIGAQYPGATRITLVMDNLNTHRPGALYETFEPAEAKALWDRFEFVHTPKHGSWLNVAEVELNVMIRQCLNRRIDSIDTLRAEVAAWQAARDRIQAKVDWQFTTDDARVKLKRLYPTFDV